VHLVGFTMEIYYDARSYKRQIIFVFSRCHSFRIPIILKQVNCLINLLHSTPYFKINVVLWETRSDAEKGPKISSLNLT